MAEHPKVARMKRIQSDLLTIGRQAVAEQQAQHIKLQAIAQQWNLDDASRRRGAAIEWERFETKAREMSAINSSLREEFAQLHAEMTAGHRQPGGSHEELLRQAAWARLEKRLDAKGPKAVKQIAADEMLKAAAAIDDRATLEAARRELPAYLSLHGETMPEGLSIWLDVCAGPPEVGDARAVGLSNEKDIYVSNMAVGQMLNVAANRQLSNVLASPTGIEGGRVAYLSPEIERQK